MTEVTAYNNPSAPTHRQWIAYVVLDNGNLWGVYAVGATEEAAKTKIQILWERERERVNRNPSGFNGATFSAPASSTSPQPETPLANDPWAGVKSTPFEAPKHHLAGMVWVINKLSREKKRVSQVEMVALVNTGDWERGGPRSK